MIFARLPWRLSCPSPRRGLVRPLTTSPYADRLSCGVDAEPLHRYYPGGFHPVHIGDRFKDGRYRVFHKLGFGGWSTVWAARDESPNRNVALKIDCAETSSQRRELRALKSFSERREGARSEHVATLLDSFKHDGPNGLHQCFVLDLLGPKVPDAIETKFEYRLPKHIATRVVRETLSGLAFIHQTGFGHGDLHTGNICFAANQLSTSSSAELAEELGEPEKGEVHGRLVGDIGVPQYLVWPKHIRSREPILANPVRIIDFGQAFPQPMQPETLRTPLVVRAPEMFFEDEIDYRAELWTMVCTIFELITGQPPFDNIMATKQTVVSQMVESLGELPQRWSGRFKADSKESENRMPNSQEWLEEVYFEADVSAEFTKEEIQSIGKLIGQLMRFEPSERMSAHEALQEWSKLFPKVDAS